MMTKPVNSEEAHAVTRPVAYRLAHVLVPAVLIGVVLYGVGGRDVWDQLRDIDPGFVIAAVIACSLQILLSAMRWRMTASFLGASMTRRRAVSEYYLSSFVNMTIPGGVVGDAARAVRARRAAGFETAAQAVVIERFAGQVALGAVLLAGLAISGRPVLQGLAAIAVVFVAVLVWVLNMSDTASIGRFTPAFVQRFGSAIRTSWSLKAGLMPQIILSLAIVGANLVAFAFAASAVGAEIGFPVVLYAVPLILLAMLIPFSIGGWGYREGAAAAVFPLIGESAALGVSASVAFGAVILLASLPGAFMVMRPADQGQAAGKSVVPHRPAE
jgi:uncharacterized membrane protein YbhN (UPF0104 family)